MNFPWRYIIVNKQLTFPVQSQRRRATSGEKMHRKSPNDFLFSLLVCYTFMCSAPFVDVPCQHQKNPIVHITFKWDSLHNNKILKYQRTLERVLKISQDCFGQWTRKHKNGEIKCLFTQKKAFSIVLAIPRIFRASFLP